MPEDRETTPHGAPDYAELGRRGAAARERNARARLDETREALQAELPSMANRLADIARNGNDPNALKAIFGTMDRVGLGPSATTNVQVGGTLMHQLITEADARLSAREAIDVPALPDPEAEQASHVANPGDYAANPPLANPASRVASDTQGDTQADEIDPAYD